MRTQEVIILTQNVPYELRPTLNARDYMKLENLGATAVIFSEDTVPVNGLDAEISAYGAANNNNAQEWKDGDSVPQRVVWLCCFAGAGRVKVTQGAK